MHRSLKLCGTHVPIVASDEFGRSGRVSACSENVLDLCGLGQRMQVGGACRRHRCQGCLARSRSVRTLGCLEGRPRCVAQSFTALTTPGELPRGTESVSRPRVVRLIGLEYLEHHLRARRSERGDLTKVLLAQNDLARLPCHGAIFDHCAGHLGGSAAALINYRRFTERRTAHGCETAAMTMHDDLPRSRRRQRPKETTSLRVAQEPA